MSGEYQLRKDIDFLYSKIYDVERESLKVVVFEEDSPLQQIFTKTDEDNQPLDKGTLDAIFTYYYLTNIIDKIYPIGAVYLSANNVNPSNYLGGYWRLLNGDDGIYKWERIDETE